MLVWRNPLENKLLGTLPDAVFLRLEPELQMTRLRAGDVLGNHDDQHTNAYFPVDSVISLIGHTLDGATAPVAEIGREGVVGVWQIFGEAPMPFRRVVLVAGHACQMPIGLLRAEFAAGNELQRALLRYAQIMMIQMAQAAICSLRHSTEQKLSRLLLASLDRLATAELEMTQQFIAGVLGVRREEVTACARKLQDAGLVEYSRGRIRILDRAGLGGRACECYAIIKNGFQRLWGSA